MQSDTQEIKALLIASIDALARELVPNGQRSGHYWIGTCPWRADKNGGSFWINLAGAKVPGSFKDAATGEKGDVIKLIQLAAGLADFKEAKDWARDWLGLERMPTYKRQQMLDQVARDRAQADKREAEKLEINRKRAFALWLGAQPISGTLAATYLAARAIDLGRLPSEPRALRFDPRHLHLESKQHLPCLMALMTGPDGKPAAVHRTWLAPDGMGKAEVTPQRKIWPSFKGAAIRVWRGASGLTEREAREAGLVETLVITEGVEDALSVALACPEHRIWAAGSLGNLNAIEPPPCAERVIICADNDWGKPQAGRQLDAALARLAGLGVSVEVARSHVGKDVNDALRGAQL